MNEIKTDAANVNNGKSPWFGTLKAQGNAASLLAEMKFQDFIDARNKLSMQVTSAYYPLYELHEWINVEQENVSILESYKTIATKKATNTAIKITNQLLPIVKRPK